MTMQADSMLSELALERGAWLINRLDLNYAAHKLEIGADYDEGREFRLVFTGFQLISWQVLEDDYDPGTMNADVIGFDLSERDQRKLAVLATDLFEIVLGYDKLEIEKAW